MQQFIKFIKKVFDKIINTIFPWIILQKSSKKLNEKINKINKEDYSNFDYMNMYNQLTLDQTIVFYNKTLEVKKSLEEKLKTSLFSVTVGITVLTSSIAILFNDKLNTLPIYIAGTIFIAGIFGVIYMFLAGIFSIRTISGKLQVFQLFPEDYIGKDNDEIRDTYAICAEMNSLHNIMRQNLMNVSFHCIINSLCIVMIFFILLGSISLSLRSTVVQTHEIIFSPNDEINKLIDESMSSYKNETSHKLEILKNLNLNYETKLNFLSEQFNNNNILFFDKLSDQQNKINELEKYSNDYINNQNIKNQEFENFIINNEKGK